jgi:hypothetical protein
MLIGVDGTRDLGLRMSTWEEFSDNLYLANNAGSFVWQVVMQSKQAPRFYVCGPGVLGFGCAPTAREIVSCVKKCLAWRPGQRLSDWV